MADATACRTPSRRRFVFLVAAAAPASWPSEVGVISLGRRLAVALGGSCSFCSKRATEVGAVTGVLGRPARICDGCVGLCGVILAEHSVPLRREPLGWDRRPKIPEPRCSFCERDDVARLIAGPRVFICDACAADAAALVSSAPRLGHPSPA